MQLHRAQAPIHGTISVPGDKSISHRAIMIGSLASGTTRVHGFLPGADCLSTINCFRAMGIEIEQNGTDAVIHGKDLHGLKQPDDPLDCGNSGTTARLISGILAGQKFPSKLIGDASLSKRPMRRIMEPLREMGAAITGETATLPLLIEPAKLSAIRYLSPVASAQVKSCVLFAGLYADGETTVSEPSLSRDHTERMLRAFGAAVDSRIGYDGRAYASVHSYYDLEGCEVFVPGDISSAAYWIAAALLVPGSELTIKNVGINPTRDGILEVVRAMGGSIELTDLRDANGAKLTDVNESAGEPVADLIVRYSALHGCEIGGDLIPRLIDELPVVAVLAAAAEGTTIIRDAAELRVKESDRIAVVTDALSAMGADVTPTEDGMIINGGRPLHGAVIDPALDHRIAMAFSIAALIADNKTEIRNADCVRISYPSFYEELRELLCK